MSLTLNIPPAICVGRQTLKGEAELHFPQVVEDGLQEVHVKLRGSVFTRISRQVGNQRIQHRERLPIVADNLSLWTRNSSFPPAGSQVLRIPFEFVIPPDAPPSCQYDRVGRHGTIGYFVELVGVRSGVLSMNRRLRQPLPVVPLDLAGEQIARSLRAADVRYPLYSSVTEKNIRRGFFGDYASVKMELSFPDTHTYPLFTPIPYTLHVATVTKPLKRDEADKNPQKPIFPSPPIKPSEIQFRLRRYIWLKARWFTATGDESVVALGGLDKATAITANGQPVDVQIGDRNFLPSESDNNVGTWLQDTAFRSTFELTCPPTFTTDIMHVKYTLEVKVDFPGIGNSLECEIPIYITSGLSTTPPSYSSTTPSQPQALDLPPSYWGSIDNWDEDEKSGA